MQNGLNLLATSISAFDPERIALSALVARNRRMRNRRLKYRLDVLKAGLRFASVGCRARSPADDLI
jgi:hypothetical protein